MVWLLIVLLMRPGRNIDVAFAHNNIIVPVSTHPGSKQACFSRELMLLPLPPPLLPPAAATSRVLQRKRKAFRVGVKARNRVSLQQQAFAALSSGLCWCCMRAVCTRARILAFLYGTVLTW